MAHDLATKLRALDEDDIADALEEHASHCRSGVPELVEAIQCVLDKLGVPDADGDVREREDEAKLG